MKLNIRRSTRSLFNPNLGKHRWPMLVFTLAAALLVCVSTAAAISFVSKWGTTGGADGQFQTPNGISVDAAGNVYVAEGNGNRVQKFNSTGGFLLKFGIPGDVPGGFVSPSGVAVDSLGNIYVSDSFTDRLQKFNSSGTFLLSWGGSGSANGKFLGASGVAVDSLNNIYVADGNNHRIQKFTSAGVFITSWGASGTGDGQFNTPQGLGIDAADNVYVADTLNNRIQKFTSAGVFVTKWGTAGAGNGEFSSPTGVGADATGNIYVADSGNSRIQAFSSTGTFSEAFGSSGSGDGQFSGPQDVAADSSGNIYVADTGNDRVQKLGTGTAVVAQAGADQTVECLGALTSITLDGTASTGGGTLSYTWKEGATVLGTGATLVVSLPVGSHNITLTVTSSAGGSSDDTVIIDVVDTTAPVITLNGDNPMTVECHTSFSDPGATANDGCAGSLSVTTAGSVDADTIGSYTIEYSTTDGTNGASATRTVNVVDTTPPNITCPADIVVNLPPNSAATSVPVSFSVTASDLCSSSVTVTTDHASGSNFTVGTTTVNATADDNNGNTSSCSFTVTVLYNFTGFFSPISNLPAFNVVNAGRAIPVKFSLSGNKGLNIFAANSPSSGPIACNSTDPATDLLETLTAGSSTLSYDAGADQYIYVWKTEPSWAGTCRQLVVQLNDGSIHRANFKFR